MVGGDLYSILLEGARALFLIVVPVTAAVTVAGSFAGVLQTSTAITDVAIGYALRLAAAAVVIYILYPSFSRSLFALAEIAFR